jgi:cysteinyl-tRNA synthetase
MLMTHYRQPIDWTAVRSVEAEKEFESWAATLIGTEAEDDGYRRAAQKAPPKPSKRLLEPLLDDLNTPSAIASLREGYKLARGGGDEEKKQFLMDCEFLGLLRHNKLWAHIRSITGRDTGGIAMAPYEVVRSLRISVANNLPVLRADALKKLELAGLGAEISPDGDVTLIPLTEAAKNLDKKIDDLIVERNAARKAKNFREADRIRDELAAMGVVLKDSKDGTTWEIAR